MRLEAQDITIAVTVYNRREHLLQAIGSALGQSMPVKVMVVEDHGPDLELRSFVLGHFGDKIAYLRNPRRRGIFGNWNACIENCQTPWLSILHDDDYLEPGFVKSMLELNRLSGTRGLYYGRTTVVDHEGNPRAEFEKPALPNGWAETTLQDVLLTPPFSFPGQLFNVQAAREQGGFRETSLYTGEWELWTKIIARHGAAWTDARVAVFRDHSGWSRGTSRIYRSGKTHGLIAMQRKRNLALAKKLGVPVAPENRFDRTYPPIPSRYVVRFARFFSPMYLRYNAGRILRSRAPNLSYRLLQCLLRAGGPSVLRPISWLVNLLQRN